MHTLHLGTSGFSFKDWKGVVYPKNMKLQDALFYYQDELGFDCVEINSTYYTLESERSFAGMERKTPADFRFMVKAYRGITHDPFDPRIKELREFIPEIRTIARKAKEIYLFFNNCHAGLAAKNALTLRQLLDIPSHENRSSLSCKSAPSE